MAQDFHSPQGQSSDYRQAGALFNRLCVWVEKEEEVVVVTRNTPRNTHHTHFISPTRSPSRALSMRDFTVH